MANYTVAPHSVGLMAAAAAAAAAARAESYVPRDNRARDPLKGRLIGSHRFRSYNEPGSNPRRFGGDVTVFLAHSPGPGVPFPRSLDPPRPFHPRIYTPASRGCATLAPSHRSLGNSPARARVSRVLVPRNLGFPARRRRRRRARTSKDAVRRAPRRAIEDRLGYCPQGSAVFRVRDANKLAKFGVFPRIRRPCV